MTDLQFVAVRILEKNRVVTGAIFQAELRAFDILAASPANDFAGFIHRFPALGPKCDPVSIRLVVGVLRKSEKGDRPISFRLEQAPLVAALIDAETDRRQDLRVKALGVLPIFHPKINVIEEALVHSLIVHGEPRVVYHPGLGRLNFCFRIRPARITIASG